MKSETTTNDSKLQLWTNRALDGLSVAIAVGLIIAGPALIAGALVLAVLAGSPSVAGIGLLAGALLGAVGAIALIWCLIGMRSRDIPANC